MKLDALGVLAASANIYNLCTLLRGKLLCQIDNLCAKVGSTTTTNLIPIILVSGTYFFTIHALSKQKHAMRHGMLNPNKLKEICYSAHMIELNEYLAAITLEKATDKIGDMVK